MDRPGVALRAEFAGGRIDPSGHVGRRLTRQIMVALAATRIKNLRYAKPGGPSSSFARINPDTRPPRFATLDTPVRSPLLIQRRFRWAPPRNASRREHEGRCARAASRLPCAKLARGSRQ